MRVGRDLVLAAARNGGVPEDFFNRLIYQESKYDPHALNEESGAYGLGQVRPSTWAKPGYNIRPGGNPNDVNEQLRFSADYAKAMLDLYGGDQAKAAAAYNWGPGNVQNWDGNPNSMPKETRNYVSYVAGNGVVPNFGEDQTNTLADMDPNTPKRNSPVTLPDAMQRQNGEKATFHPGVGLQSLGAALAASARGEDASGQLGDIRRAYFEERQIAAEKARKDAERAALTDLVGADGPYGQALQQGADPAVVMDAYLQAKGFTHDERVQLNQQGWESGENAIRRAHETNERLGAQEYGTSERLGAQEYGTSERLGAQEYGTNERIDTQKYGTNERIDTQKYGTSERLGGEDHETEMQTGRFKFEDTQGDKNVERDKARYDFQHGLDLENAYVANQYSRWQQDDQQEATAAITDKNIAADHVEGEANRGVTTAGQNKTQEESREDRKARNAEAVLGHSEFLQTFDHNAKVFDLEQQQGKDRGQAAQKTIVSTLDKLGMKDQAAEFAKLPPEAFKDPSMVSALQEFIVAGKNSIPDSIEKFQYYQELLSIGDTAGAASFKNDFMWPPGSVTNNTVTTGDKANAEVDKQAAIRDSDEVKAINENAEGYRPVVQVLDQMESTLTENPDMPVGRMYDMIQPALEVARDSGLFSPKYNEDVDDRQNLEQLNKFLSTYMRRPNSGSSSDFDASMYLESGIKGNSREGIVTRLKQVRSLAGRETARANYLSERINSRDKNGKAVPLSKAKKEWDEKTKRGDPETMPTYRDYKAFPLENNRAIAPLQVGDWYRDHKGEKLQVMSQEAADKINGL